MGLDVVCVVVVCTDFSRRCVCTSTVVVGSSDSQNHALKPRTMNAPPTPSLNSNSSTLSLHEVDDKMS